MSGAVVATSNLVIWVSILPVSCLTNTRTATHDSAVFSRAKLQRHSHTPSGPDLSSATGRPCRQHAVSTPAAQFHTHIYVKTAACISFRWEASRSRCMRTVLCIHIVRPPLCSRSHFSVVRAHMRLLENASACSATGRLGLGE
ncbi:hypothetical protein BKA80DRAFT_95627 [Phyllosticta citrichinensis]